MNDVNIATIKIIPCTHQHATKHNANHTKHNLCNASLSCPLSCSIVASSRAGDKQPRRELCCRVSCSCNSCSSSCGDVCLRNRQAQRVLVAATTAHLSLSLLVYYPSTAVQQPTCNTNVVTSEAGDRSAVCTPLPCQSSFVPRCLQLQHLMRILQRLILSSQSRGGVQDSALGVQLPLQGPQCIN